MNRKDVLNNIINEILETDLIFKDIFYKIEESGVYLTLITKKGHAKQYTKVFYEDISSVIHYLSGIRKTLYLLELEVLNDEK